MARASITLDVDGDLLNRANEAAAARHTTVSEMVEQFLRALAMPPLRSEEITPSLRKLSGILPPMSDAERQQTLEEEISRKHGA